MELEWVGGRGPCRSALVSDTRLRDSWLAAHTLRRAQQEEAPFAPGKKHTKKSWRGAKGEALAWSDAQRTYDSARLRGARRRQGGHAIVTGGREEAEEVGTPRKVVVVSRAHNT